MARGSLHDLVGHVRRLLGGREGCAWSDGQLLERFIGQGDEAAFEQLMQRHGSMVLGVCRRVLAGEINGEQGAPAVAEAYDFSGIRKLVDVAGGHGLLLRTVLKRYSSVHGVLFDLPEVIERGLEAPLAERFARIRGFR